MRVKRPRTFPSREGKLDLESRADLPGPAVMLRVTHHLPVLCPSAQLQRHRTILCHSLARGQELITRVPMHVSTEWHLSKQRTRKLLVKKSFSKTAREENTPGWRRVAQRGPALRGPCRLLGYQRRARPRRPVPEPRADNWARASSSTERPEWPERPVPHCSASPKTRLFLGCWRRPGSCGWKTPSCPCAEATASSRRPSARGGVHAPAEQAGCADAAVHGDAGAAAGHMC